MWYKIVIFDDNEKTIFSYRLKEDRNKENPSITIKGTIQDSKPRIDVEMQYHIPARWYNISSWVRIPPLPPILMEIVNGN